MMRILNRKAAPVLLLKSHKQIQGCKVLNKGKNFNIEITTDKKKKLFHEYSKEIIPTTYYSILPFLSLIMLLNFVKIFDLWFCF